MKRYAVSVNSYSDPVIQAGKRYEVFDWHKDPDETDPIAFFSIQIMDRKSGPFKANCIAFQPCAYLEGEEWTIIEEEEPSDDN